MLDLATLNIITHPRRGLTMTAGQALLCKCWASLVGYSYMVPSPKYHAERVLVSKLQGVDERLPRGWTWREDTADEWHACCSEQDVRLPSRAAATETLASNATAYTVRGCA